MPPKEQSPKKEELQLLVEDRKDDASAPVGQARPSKSAYKGISFKRYFTEEGKKPLEETEYEKRKTVITEPDGKVVFQMDNLDIPKNWSQLATDIVSSKYFRKAGVPGTGHETSVAQVITRVTSTIRAFGENQGYFASPKDAEIFEDELTHLLVNQKGAFNSPVWFNCGLHQKYGIKGSGGNYFWNPDLDITEETPNSYEHPQCSACFIQKVNDDLMTIFELAKNEARLFKFGSGTGSNFTPIRGKQEKLSGGGFSSGLMSFLQVLDRGAGATKSGGTTRRAAKMVILDMVHPEIVDFINWKVREEQKVKALIDAGYSADFNGEAYQTVSGQNSNNSVRVTDDFMEKALNKGKWTTYFRTTGEACDEYEAETLLDQISHAAWACADPGIQFDDTINDWHTCSNTDRINASNPCSEYMFLDNTACNLASLNLMKFLVEDQTFDIRGFREACRIFTTAQEVLVDLSSYPTKTIAENSHDYRPLGLGYANLGTLLMVKGIPYDSEEGRAIAAAITAVMNGRAYATSAEIAEKKGPFPGYIRNREPMLRVMNKHRDAVYRIDPEKCSADLLKAAKEDWERAVALGENFGYRNAQATVLAPTGTIGLLMDCDTTGVEPEFSIVKWKKLAGGGYFKIINQSIPKALRNLGYSAKDIDQIIKYVLGHGTIEGAPYVNEEAMAKLGYTDDEIKEVREHIDLTKCLDEWTPHINPKELKKRGLKGEEISRAVIYVSGAQTLEGTHLIQEEHLPVFDCANKCGIGKRFIAPMGHIKMMAAVQPFLSGAISKTVNLPNEAKVEEIRDIYVEGWKLGLKSIALYRDGCKFSQPLSSSSSSKPETKEEKAEIKPEPRFMHRGEKVSLPQKRNGITVGASVGGHKIYLRTGEYHNGKIGELFIDMFKEGASYRSLLNCFAVAVSLGLQYGVPLEKFVEKFTFTRFEPAGMTDHANIKSSTSVLDFVFRVLGMEYLKQMDFVHVAPVDIGEDSEASEEDQLDAPETSVEAVNKQLSNLMGDAPVCDVCGHITVRNGACYKCLNCGNSMGCS